MTLRLALSTLLVCTASAGCTAAVPGEAVPRASVAPSTSLPFNPTIGGRTNDRTDGTSFEPCTAYTPDDLALVAIDFSTMKDAAFSDSPNFRGCDWSTSDRMWVFGQIVGDEASLDDYKRQQTHRTWRVDQTINGRRVGVVLDPPGSCVTAFMAEQAVVLTSVMSSTKRRPEPDFATECDMALKFTELATRKAPR